MTKWRLFAEVPERAPPLFHAQDSQGEVILLDPALPPGENWVWIEVSTDRAQPLFILWSDSAHGDRRPDRYYVPTDAEDGFATELPSYAGHWRRHEDLAAPLRPFEPPDDPALPWPVPDPSWPDRAAFLAQLDRVEATAYEVAYRGFSNCRLCGQRNGCAGLRLGSWEWPEGYRHYIADHGVRPEAEFAAFVAARAR